MAIFVRVFQTARLHCSPFFKFIYHEAAFMSLLRFVKSYRILRFLRKRKGRGSIFVKGKDFAVSLQPDLIHDFVFTFL